MRILYVAMDAAPYSDRSHEVKVAEEMVRQGHEVLLAAEREPRWSAESPKPEGLTWLGPGPVNVPSEAASLASALPGKVDVAFTSSASGAPLLAAWKKRYSRPAVAQVLDVPMWRLRLGEQGPWRASWQPWFEGLRSMDAVIANTRVTAADLETCAASVYPGSGLPRVEVVYYGVDTEVADAAEPLRPPGPEGMRWAVSVGRLVPYRGVDLAILGLALVPKAERPGLIVVGAGEDRERLAHLAILAGVPVVFTGGVSDAGKWRVIKGADLGMALQFNPNIPQQAPMEFAYAGVPGIVADLPIHRERSDVVEPRMGPHLVGPRTGRGVEYVDPLDTRSIASVVRDESVPRFHRERAADTKAWVQEHRSFRSHARGVLKVLEEVRG